MYNIITVNGDGIVIGIQQTSSAYTLGANQYFVQTYDESLVGQTRNSDGTFTPTTTPPDMRVTKLAFKQRMTAAERIAIRTAATTDAIVYDFMDLVDSATFIDLARQDTQDGVNYLESAGLLAAGRAAQILTNPITDEERP